MATEERHASEENAESSSRPRWLRDAIHTLFSPSHTHAADDGALEDVLTTTAAGIRTLKVSTAILAAVALAELAIATVSGSVAVLGDTIHNAADVATALPLGLAFWLQRRPPTRRYTYGYGRAEDLAGVMVCLVIAASAIATAFVAIERLVHPHAVTHLGLVAAAGAVGMLGNEVVAVYRIRVGRRLGSAALVADGRHARIDGLTSLAVVVGAIGVAAGWSSADSVVGLAISVVILNVLRGAMRDIFRRLMDSVDPSLVDRIEEVLAAVHGVDRVEHVRVRWIGHRLEAEATIYSDGTMSLAAAHAVAEEAHHRLLHDVPRLTYALIHSDPSSDGPGGAHSLTEHHYS